MFKKIFLTFFILALCPLFFLSVIYFLHISNSISNELTVGIKNSLKVIDTFDARIVDERISDMLSFKTMSIPEVCFEYNRPEAMRVFLKNINHNNMNYSALVAHRSNGDLFSIWNIRDEKKYNRNLSAEVINKKMVGECIVKIESIENQFHIMIISPIYNSINEPIGFISGYIKWDVFDEIFYDYQQKELKINPFTKKSERSLELFYDVDMNPINKTAKSMSLDTVGIIDALQSKEVVEIENRGDNYVLTCMPMGNSLLLDNNITHCLAVDRDDAYKPLRYLRNQTIFIAFISIVGIVVLSLFFTKKLLEPFQGIYDVLFRHEEVARLYKNKTSDQVSLGNLDLMGMKSAIIELINMVMQSESLRIEKERMEAKAKAKSLFMANMSHEIRTPLNTILGFSELLKNEVGGGRKKGYVENIYSSGKMLLSIVNDILDFSKLEKGKIVFDYVPMSLVSVMKEIEGHFSDKMKEKGICFEVNVNPDLEVVRVRCDETRFKQIIINLISNAYRFTDIGYVKVSVQSLEIKGNLSSFRVLVEDSGVGISNTDIIFREFEQLKSAEYKDHGGSGLGLSITKRLVEMFNAQLDVKSTVGVGSKFLITFNNMEVLDYQRPISNTYTQKREVHFNQATILVVDDNKKNRDMIGEYFRIESDLVVLKAENGQRAIDIAMKTNIDLILMDLRMPLVDGFEATEYFKESNKFKEIPIVILTADITEATKKKIINVCDDYLLKPVAKEGLVKILKKYLKHEEKEFVGRKGDSKILDDFNIGNSSINLYKDLYSLKKAMWTNIKCAMVVGEVEKFSKCVMNIGNKYQHKTLIKWAERLLRHSKDYNAKSMRAAIDQFPVIVERLRIVDYSIDEYKS